MSLKIEKPVVSSEWLFNHLEDKNLIVLDATLPKVTALKKEVIQEKYQIKNAVFFDIKKVFSDVNAPFPNTVLSAKEFEHKAQNLGIYKDSCIVVYDDLGIYSSPRVWWLFQLMGFTNIAVLDGGFPDWVSKEYAIEKPKEKQRDKGDFTANFKPEKLKFTNDVLAAINNNKLLIADARSKGRFYATAPEPREDVKGGHIPNSVSLPFNDILTGGKLKSEKELKLIFKKINPENKELIFSCGTGITASVLALGAEIAGNKNCAVYDGSWTEWGSTNNLPIEK
ncbi:sulfurtransferase [Polaribacter vadi]|uniref:sulfurtransferase n=1 Tax=Polaribacter TaxID=52959 RepID=UPI001C0925AE|nr:MULTISPECIES: sulfurtransferase [Polaribacter]MBU3012519.1 sulfurtransferase [Polaribacter vadi]MDO6742336.1 sulfurtransferase [Polaribacter sp. 1_MG-2023]